MVGLGLWDANQVLVWQKRSKNEFCGPKSAHDRDEVVFRFRDSGFIFIFITDTWIYSRESRSSIFHNVLRLTTVGTLGTLLLINLFLSRVWVKLSEISIFVCRRIRKILDPIRVSVPPLSPPLYFKAFKKVGFLEDLTVSTRFWSQKHLKTKEKYQPVSNLIKNRWNRTKKLDSVGQNISIPNLVFSCKTLSRKMGLLNPFLVVQSRTRTLCLTPTHYAHNESVSSRYSDL